MPVNTYTAGPVFAPATIPGLTGFPATIVGGATALQSDDGDTSYVQCGSTTVINDYYAQFSWVGAPLPAGAIITQTAVTSSVANLSVFPASLQLELWEPDGSVFYSVNGDWTSPTVVPIYSHVTNGLTSGLPTAAQFNRAIPAIRNTGDVVIRVSWLTLAVTWTSGVLPPCRQAARGDLAASRAVAALSRQATFRQGANAFL